MWVFCGTLAGFSWCCPRIRFRRTGCAIDASRRVTHACQPVCPTCQSFRAHRCRVIPSRVRTAHAGRTSGVCRQQKLPAFLNHYRFFSGLALHWVLFGPAGRVTRPSSGGVLRHYRRCNKAPTNWIKSIVNTCYVRLKSWNPHTFEYECVLCLSQAFKSSAISCRIASALSTPVHE